METFFKDLSQALFANIRVEEGLVLNYHEEQSLFIRFNKSKVRQVSDVDQKQISITLKSGGCECSIKHTLCGDLNQDVERCLRLLESLRERLRGLKPLPFYTEIENHGQSQDIYEGEVLQADDYIQMICSEAKDVDLVGILTSGTIAKGNANSKGQHHWYQSCSFSFDYSLYTEKEKAVKASYCGTKFSKK